MNILFLAPNVNIKARTGDAVHVRELAINLAELGNNITLVAGYTTDSPSELKLLLDHPNIYLAFNRTIFKIRFPLSRDISTLWTCLKLALKNPPDVIYERCFSCKIGTMLSKILRKTLVVEVNGLVEEEAELQGKLVKHRFTNNIRRRFQRFFFKSANKIVAVSQGIKEELVRKYNITPNKIIVIPNGANTDLFKPMFQKSMKDELGLSQENKYVCFVGNLAPWQGVEYLIQAAPLVLEKVPETKFLIIGDGMMRNEWENMVSELGLENCFIFTGSVPYTDVPKYINASDICVALFIRAKSEKMSPLKIFEYMACGKTVAGSNIRGVGDFLEESNAGVSFILENSTELANAILKLLINTNLRNIMEKKGRQVILEKYSWKAVAKRVETVMTNEL